MRILLRTTDINLFFLQMWENEDVVRNQQRISALLATHLSELPPRYKYLLAGPHFSGTTSNERIAWLTDAFISQPVSLASLKGEEREKYDSILKDTLEAYAEALESIPSGVADILRKAITYHSKATVYCADDKVVITEWGMIPKNRSELTTLSLYTRREDPKYSYSSEETTAKEADGASISDRETDESSVSSEGAYGKPSAAEESGSFSALNSREENKDSFDISEESQSFSPEWQDDTFISATSSEKEKGIPENLFVAKQKKGVERSKEEPADKGWENRKRETLEGEEPAGMTSSAPGESRPLEYVPWWKRNRKVLFFLLLLLLLLGLWSVLRGCGPTDPLHGFPEVPPPFTGEDIEISPDSLTREVNNRLILLIVSGGSVSDFVRDFRQVYPDEQRYRFVSPDTVIPRIILLLPKEDKQRMIEELPAKFPGYDLEVLPETIFESSVMTNDPALKEERKSWYFDMCGIREAWDVTMGNENIIVAVIDDGFDLDHPEIKGKIVKPYNAVRHTRQVFPSQVGHGMHVAATAVGYADNGEGSAGIAPHCQLMPIQVANESGLMPTSAIVDAALYAIMEGADVVNMSLGMAFGPQLQMAPVWYQQNLIAHNFLAEERMWKRIFEMAAKRNVTFVLAGGNENILIGIDPMQRSLQTIKVSAVQPDRKKADFSNFGDFSTLSAPGVAIYNAMPGGRYGFLDGTSMASPIVAGAVALLKSQNKSLSTAEIVRILDVTGIPSPSQVGHIIHLGHALHAATGGVPGVPGHPNPEADPCKKVQERFRQLQDELECLKRKYPECCKAPDTLTIPEGVHLADLTGRWRSTTKLINHEEKDVVLYFDFNGTAEACLSAVEPDGSVFSASLSVSIANDMICLLQITEAVSPTKLYHYPPYRFVCRPSKGRKAECTGKNRFDAANKISFRLVKMN